ncbi:hypothetical protein SprV_0100228900 [Sparganum proliferum]
MTHLVGLSGGLTAPAAGGEGYDWLNEGRISPKQYCINLPAFSVVPPRCYYDLADFGLIGVRQFLKTDDSIVIVPADKGGATVIMDKVDYVQKANTVFNDREAYAPLAEGSTKKQAAVIKKKVNELARLKMINPNDSKFMTLSDPRIAHAYGLPNVHKPDAPLKIIVPLIGSPTYSLTKWLYRHLKHLADGSQYSIKDSRAFLEKIQGLKVSPDESILSFDVVALFSSIPHDLAIESVARRLRDNPIDIPTHHVLEMLKLCLNNYCQFDGKYYQQVKGTPMGSPISGQLAELVLQ